MQSYPEALSRDGEKLAAATQDAGNVHGSKRSWRRGKAEEGGRGDAEKQNPNPTPDPEMLLLRGVGTYEERLHRTLEELLNL